MQKCCNYRDTYLKLLHLYLYIQKISTYYLEDSRWIAWEVVLHLDMNHVSYVIGCLKKILPYNCFNHICLHFRFHGPCWWNTFMYNMVTTSSIVMSVVVTLFAVSYWMITVVTSTFRWKTYRYCWFIGWPAVLKQISVQREYFSSYWLSNGTLFSHTIDTCCIGWRMSKNIWLGCSLWISFAHSMQR